MQWPWNSGTQDPEKRKKGKKCTVTELEFSRAEFGLFRDLLGKILLDAILEQRDFWKSWLTHKDQLLQAQEQYNPMTGTPNKYVARPAWLNKEVLSELEHQKETFKKWKKSHVIQEKYKDTVRTCSVKKAEAHLEYNGVRDMKGNKKGVFRHISNKRKSRENVGVLLNGTGDKRAVDKRHGKNQGTQCCLYFCLYWSYFPSRIWDCWDQWEV